MREALQINPDNVDYQKMLAQALEQGGNKAEATQVLRKVLANDPDPWYATVTLARNFEELKAYDSAIAVLRQFSDAHPGDQRAAGLISKYQSMKQQPTVPNSTAVVPLMPSVPAKQKG
jgi:cytochrome c-type biogenesis protein CcmH/NrfG